MNSTHPVRPARTAVLIVDASAVARQVLSGLLAREPDMDVTTAPDPVIALARMKHRRPDVVLCDLQLPRLDGMQFVREVSKSGIPVVVCARLEDNSDSAIRALESGAVDVMEKPAGGIRNFVFESAPRVAPVVRAAAHASRAKSSVSKPQAPVASNVEYRSRPGIVVAIGASTGGTEAIRTILEQLPRNAPPLLIVQHMPSGFTAAFARRLNDLSRMEVVEAKGGEVLVPGLALIAPGNRHLVVRRKGGIICSELWAGPRINGHRPSVDVLFESVAEATRGEAIGVILTGMGADGSEGLLRMHETGAFTIAQDERTSVVFGMPKNAITRGGAEITSGLSRISGLVLSHAAEPRWASRRAVI